MLQKMHEHIRGWVATVVLVAVCLAFLFFGIEYYVGNTAAGSQHVVAKVAGEKITQTQVDKRFRRLQRQYAASGRSLTDQTNAQLKVIAQQQLISETALTQAARRSGFVTTPQQVDGFIMNLSVFQEKGVYSPNRFKQFLQARGLSERQFTAQLAQEMTVNQVANAISMSAFVLPFELKSYYSAVFQRRRFSYLLLKGAMFKKAVTVSDQAIQRYYQNHQADFRVPLKVSIEYLQLSPKTVSQSVHVDDARVKQYYEDNLSNYRRPAMWTFERVFLPVPATATPKQQRIAKEKVREWVVSLKKGQSFSALMKAQQGITQTLSENQVPPALLTALQTLKPSQVSAPVKTQQGYSIVRLRAVTPATTLPFSHVRVQIKKMLLEQKTQEKLSAQNEQLSSLTYMNPGTLAPAAKALKTPVQTTAFFSREGLKTGLAADPNVLALVFSDDVLKQGNNSHPVVQKDGSVVVLRVKARQPSHLPPLATLRETIKQQLSQKLSQAKAALLANTLQTALLKGSDPTSLAKQHQLVWHTSGWVTRHDQSVKPAILTTVFARLSLKGGRRIATTALANGDVAVVRLDAIQPPHYATVPQGRQQALKVQLQRALGRLEYELYVHSVKQETTITGTSDGKA
jgi:peptidyl-prolyl cis-trans isomerase D